MKFLKAPASQFLKSSQIPYLAVYVFVLSALSRDCLFGM